MFINVTNYPSLDWEEKQQREAALFGCVEDLIFPNVDASLSASEVTEMAHQMVEQIVRIIWEGNDRKNGVLIMGEPSLTYALVQECQLRRITAFCATFRIELNEDEELTQQFVKFREYARRIVLEEDE